MRHETDPDASSTALVGVVGAVLLVVVILLLQAYFYQAERQEGRDKVESVAVDELVASRSEQQELLNSYRWIDQPAGVVGLPIEHAMAIVVERAGAAAPTLAARR